MYRYECSGSNNQRNIRILAISFDVNVFIKLAFEKVIWKIALHAHKTEVICNKSYCSVSMFTMMTLIFLQEWHHLRTHTKNLNANDLFSLQAKFMSETEIEETVKLSSNLFCLSV